jgi:polysaccharide export outer membrane protein
LNTVGTCGMRLRFSLVLAAILGAMCLPVGARQALGSNTKANSDALPSTAKSYAAPSGHGKGPVASADGSADAVNTEQGDVYRIGVEDELQISVWREPEMSNTVVVRPDGMITMPLLNDIQVVGLRTEDLQALLTEKLKPFVNEPQVTVIVRQIRSRRVYVFGQVARQGTFQLNTRKTVLEVLAEAGGISQFAKSRAMYILRTQSGKRVRIPIDYKKVVAGQSQNLALYPGDVIVVP